MEENQESCHVRPREIGAGKKTSYPTHNLGKGGKVNNQEQKENARRSGYDIAALFLRLFYWREHMSKSKKYSEKKKDVAAKGRPILDD